MSSSESCNYLGSSGDYNRSRSVILGAPLERTVCFRGGTGEGPAHIRMVSEVLEEYSPGLGKDLADFRYYDAGDLDFTGCSVEESLERISDATAGLFGDGKFPVILGGEHLVTLPVVEQAASYYPGLAVVHFDAHADLRNEYLGLRLSHATVMRRVAEVTGEACLFQFGIRSGTREEFDLAAARAWLYPGLNGDNLADAVNRIGSRPVYITLDIDVLDPAYAPGTGTPEPDGCTPGQLFDALEALAGLDVVGFDLVEVAPRWDPSWRTSILAAKLVREAILLFTG